MTTRFRWQVDGPEVEADEASEPERNAAQSMLGHRRWLWIPVIVAGYLVAVALSGWLGFHIGRWSIADAAQRDAIEAQLALEEIAWKGADSQLFASTLDPGAPRRWRERQLRSFSAAAPKMLDLRVAERSLVRPDLAKVQIEIAAAGTTRSEVRMYRLVSGAWLNTPPSPSPTG